MSLSLLQTICTAYYRKHKKLNNKTSVNLKYRKLHYCNTPKKNQKNTSVYKGKRLFLEIYFFIHFILILVLVNQLQLM